MFVLVVPSSEVGGACWAHRFRYGDGFVLSCSSAGPQRCRTSAPRCRVNADRRRSEGPRRHAEARSARKPTSSRFGSVSIAFGGRSGRQGFGRRDRGPRRDGTVSHSGGIPLAGVAWRDGSTPPWRALPGVSGRVPGLVQDRRRLPRLPGVTALACRLHMPERTTPASPYSSEFRRRVLDLIASGRKVADVR